jgi:hypothetical protein
MKKLFVVALVLLVAVGMTVTGVSAAKPGIDFNGPHYNLNLLGKNWEYGSHDGQFDNPDRGTIFIPIDTTGYTYTIETKWHALEAMPGIMFNITQDDAATDFSVLDGNAIDDGKCALEMPAGHYEVYIAVKAKNPKYDDAYTDITGMVYVENVTSYWLLDIGDVTVRKNKDWTDASDLLFVDDSEIEDLYGDFEWKLPLDIEDWSDGNATYYDTDTYEGIWVFDFMNAGGYLDYLFDDAYDAFYFWDIDNHGNKQIKLRFYEI